MKNQRVLLGSVKFRFYHKTEQNKKIYKGVMVK